MSAKNSTKAQAAHLEPRDRQILQNYLDDIYDTPVLETDWATRAAISGSPVCARRSPKFQMSRNTSGSAGTTAGVADSSQEPFQSSTETERRRTSTNESMQTWDG